MGFSVSCPIVDRCASVNKNFNVMDFNENDVEKDIDEDETAP